MLAAVAREERAEARLRLDDAVGERAVALARLAREPRQAHAPGELAVGVAAAVGLDQALVALALGEHGVDALGRLHELLLVGVARVGRGVPVRQHLRLHEGLELELEVVDRRLHRLHELRR